jgi:TonB family protein
MARERTAGRGVSSRRTFGSLALALGLHALLGLLVFAAPEPPRAADPPLTVELIEVPPVAAPPPAPPADRVPPRRKRAPVTLRPDLAPSERAGGAGGGTGGIAEAATPQTETSIEAAPQAEVEGERGPDPGEVRLFDRGALAESVSRWKAERGEGNGSGVGGRDRGVGDRRGDGRGTGEGDGAGPEVERARVAGRIARDLEDAQAADRVRAGLVDPYFRELKWGFKEGWRPTPGMMGGSDGDDALARLQNLLRAWNETGRRYASSGSPYAEGDSPSGVDHVGKTAARPNNGTSGFDAADFAARWNSGEFAFPEAIVLLRVTQDMTGRPLGIEVLQSSGYRIFDESARQAALAAAVERPAPAYGLGLGGQRIETIWSFAAKAVPQTCSLPPDPTGRAGVTGGAGFMPGISCGGTFDEVLGEAELPSPGSTKVITKIELVAIYGGQTGPRVE